MQISLRHICLFLLLFCLMTGCKSLSDWRNNDFKLGPDYKKPKIDTATNWLESDSLFNNDEQLRQDWWTVFNDPMLDQLVKMAAEENLSLKAAALRIFQARTSRRISRFNLFPQSQSASGSYGYNLSSQNSATSFPGAQRSFDSWSSSFDLSWELDIWGRLRRIIEADDATLDAEIDSYDDLMVTLIGDVAVAYIEIRSLDKRLTLAEANADIQSGSLQIANTRYDEGETTNLDVQQAISNHAETLALIPQLRQQRRTQINGLATLLGKRPDQIQSMFKVRGQLPLLPDKVVVGIPANLLRRRPDIRAAERAVAIQSAQIGIQMAELYPQFTLSSNIGLNSEQFAKMFATTSGTGMISPGFTWKILNYGRLKAGVKIEELKLEEAILDYENAILLAQQEVEDAMIAFLEGKLRAAELKRSSDAAEKSVELVGIQYREGEVDFDRVFNLESSLVQKQDDLVSTEADVAISLIRLYKALGGGWQLGLSYEDKAAWLNEKTKTVPLLADS